MKQFLTKDQGHVGQDFSHVALQEIYVIPLCKFVWKYVWSSEWQKKIKKAAFWDVTLCGSCKNWRFGGT
jgi:hypothetical protein